MTWTAADMAAVLDTRIDKPAYPSQSVLDVPGVRLVREASSEALSLQVWVTPVIPGSPARFDWALLLIPVGATGPAVIELTDAGEVWGHEHLVRRFPTLHGIFRVQDPPTPAELDRFIAATWRDMAALRHALGHQEEWWGKPVPSGRAPVLFLLLAQYGYTSYAEGQQWQGVFDYKALANGKAWWWRARGFTAQDVVDWLAIEKVGGLHVGDEQAEQWRDRGFTPITALPYLTAAQRVTPAAAQRWVKAGFTVAQVRGCVAAGMTLTEARAHRASGDAWRTVQTLAALRGTVVPPQQPPSE